MRVTAHTRTLELLPQLRFLHVHVIFHATAGQRAHAGADQGVLQLVAFRQQAHHRARCGTDARALGSACWFATRAYTD